MAVRVGMIIEYSSLTRLFGPLIFTIAHIFGMIQVDSECTAPDDFRQQRTLLVPLDKAHDQHYIRLNLTDKKDRAMIHKLLFYII